MAIAPTAKTTGTCVRWRSWSVRIAGASAVTRKYTAMNHSGWATSFVAGPRSCRDMPMFVKINASGIQTASSTKTGLRRRCALLTMNALPVRPSRQNAESVTELEKPPTKKNTGITCNIQVRRCNIGTASSVFAAVNLPWRTVTDAMSQWPNITTKMLVARRKSTARSRLAGVFCASSRAVLRLGMGCFDEAKDLRTRLSCGSAVGQERSAGVMDQSSTTSLPVAIQQIP